MVRPAEVPDPNTIKRETNVNSRKSEFSIMANVEEITEVP